MFGEPECKLVDRAPVVAMTDSNEVHEIRQQVAELANSRTARSARKRNGTLPARHHSVPAYYGSCAVPVFLGSVSEGNFNRVLSFLEDPAFCCRLPTVVDREGRTALHLAALEGYVRACVRACVGDLATECACVRACGRAGGAGGRACGCARACVVACVRARTPVHFVPV
jgi:hypothetical protein